MPPKLIVYSGKAYSFLKEEDVTAKGQKYVNHIKNLNNCFNYIKVTSSFVDELNKQELSNNIWQEYISCSIMPKPYIPPDIRSFISKLKFRENISIQETFNWLLSVDEHSILTQNFEREDFTYSTLKVMSDQQGFGSVYNHIVENCLKMLQRIDDFLDDSEGCGAEKLEDIKELRTTLQELISELFNRFTYRILSSEKAYMNSLDAITAEYNFEGVNFQIDIWTLKNVPIRLGQLEEPRFIVNLNAVKAILSIPVFIMKENFTIRAIHMNFDHISDNNPLFLQEIVEPSEIASFGLQDLTECIKNEWLNQLEMMHHVRNEMILKREEYYKEQQRLKDEKNNKQEEGDETRGFKKKRHKVKKKAHPAAEPDFIGDDMFPNVWAEFFKEEQIQYEIYFNAMYNPLLKDINSDEIDLKKYFILGGIYQLYQVKKPQHVDFKSLKITNHFNDSKLEVIEDLTIPLSFSNINFQRKSSIRRETRKSLSLRIEQPLAIRQCPWFILTIQLPEHLCYWGEPIVCQYESVTIVKTNPVVLEEQDGENMQLNTMPVVQVSSFVAPKKEGQTESLSKLHQSSKEIFLKTLLSNIYLDQEVYPSEEGVLNICDFPLNSILSKAHIRHIQRHVVPRMISSFKFNKEIKEYQLEALQSKAHTSKAKLGILARKHSNMVAEVKPENKTLFTIGGDMQNNPERLIPIFIAPTDPIRLLEIQANIKDPDIINKNIKSFAQLVVLINFIKWWHKNKIHKLLDLQPFQSKFPTSNKLIRKKFRKPLLLETLQKSASKFKARSSQRKSRLTFVEPTKSPSVSSSISSDSSSKAPISDSVDEEKLLTYTYSHWTTKHIVKSDYDKANRTIVIQTNKLGYFGFAFKQYEQFPFKFWSLEPNQNNPENEIIFTIETQYVRCVLYINEKGIRCSVTEPTTKKYVRTIKTYMKIDEPLNSMKKLKQLFREKNLNIFADKDASFYIENGYFTEKHLPTEQHTYNCMAVNCTQMNFFYCQWNRLAKRRDIILKFMQYQDLEANIVEVRITPEEAYFVETSELCSDDLDIIKLKFELTWRNLSFNSDLQNLVDSMYPGVSELKCKNAKLLMFVKNLLYETRPLSFS